MLIKLKKELFELVLNKQKHATTRKGFKTINHGLAYFCDPENESDKIPIFVHKIERTNWKTVKEKRFLHIDEGYQSKKEFHKALLNIYGALYDNDPMTIIHFKMSKDKNCHTDAGLVNPNPKLDPACPKDVKPSELSKSIKYNIDDLKDNLEMECGGIEAIPSSFWWLDSDIKKLQEIIEIQGQAIEVLKHGHNIGELDLIDFDKLFNQTQEKVKKLMGL